PGENVTLIDTDGWEIDDGYGFYEHTFAELGDCELQRQEVELEAPTFTEATCDNPEVGVDIPEQEGVNFQVQGDMEEGETITIIAQPGENVTLIDTDGWEIDDGYRL